MMAFLAKFWGRLWGALKRMASEEENGCRRCGVCHHVCQLVKSREAAEDREE